ncbi:hypothetical protein [Cellulomonas sp. SLBN-39]|uniref:hypothetical protein n=1 Tax=Cellulomonas sp. SLBN-39 TaxID=2768446 RepID=UPI0011522AD1|nr:hypothetical protein [Cellulomonas sp. SLBN-39]TQL02966.1 hypothetical protein FBY24_2054 [Cellulomonas sp. SLBN-39]
MRNLAFFHVFALLLWVLVPLAVAGLLYLVVRWGIRDGLTDARRREAAEQQVPPVQGPPAA